MDFSWVSVLQAILAVTVYAVTPKDPCTSRKDCSTCIQEPLCSWCSDPKLESPTRCSQKQQSCGAEFLFDPINNSTNLVNKPLVSHENSASQVVQVAPQEIHLKARINVPINMTLRYARADNKIDLYYLMDLSYSMKDDKDTLSSLGKKLKESMMNYTSDLQLGFGSFVDKVVGPYTNTVPSMLAAPCKNCTAPYGFYNHLKLSNDTEKFTAEVAKAGVSGNVDDIEGGLDALMQAIVCTEQIGWRDKARRLLIFSTDSGFHMAGDGKNAINVIFAVTEPQVKAYGYLAKSVEGAKASSLTEDSSNILQLVEEQYKQISSSVEMTYKAPDFVNITFFTSCQNSAVTQSNYCDDLNLGQEVEFQVQVTVTSCPPNPKDWTTDFKIYPVGSQEESLVHLELQCDCPCEHKDDPNYKPDAPECSHNGTYMCGICKCDESHTGQICECDSNQLISSGIGTSNCRSPGDEYDCSDRGICFCGICQCNQRDNKEEAGLKSECKQLLPCVLCMVHKTGPLNEQECAGNCTELNIEVVEELEESSQNVENCVELDSRRCRCEYQYIYNETSILAIKALRNLDCPPVLGIASIIGGILALILIIGIIALALWKIFVTTKDRREYAAFENEKKRANFDAGGNPLYRKPTTTFKNPMYGGTS
ncbi:Integrin beta-PS [Blattella germanica]|nr:Integrin beta-PS [Blattella germanica]